MSAVATKTQRRQRTIKRGTSAGSTLGEKALARAAIAEVREISQQPHTDHGANTGEDIQRRAELASSMAAETYSAPDETAADVHRYDMADCRYVPLSFLLEDLRRMARNRTRGFSKTERADIATDAALLLMRWTKQGSTAPIYLGTRGELPLRRDWFDPEKRTTIRDGQSTRPAPNARAIRAMRAAILQVVRDRNADSEAALNARAAELDAVRSKKARSRSATKNACALLSIDDQSVQTQSTLAAAALKKAQDSAEFMRTLPDTDEPAAIQNAMGVSLSAARTLTARGYGLTPRACAELWDVSLSRAENILSTGSAELRKTYPDAAELLTALSAAAETVRANLATRAYRALADFRDRTYWQDADVLAADAARAVNEYRACVAELPMERRAIELAARAVGWQPDNISAADQITRLLSAERKRARRSATGAGSGSHLPGKRDRTVIRTARPLKVWQPDT